MTWHNPFCDPTDVPTDACKGYFFNEETRRVERCDTCKLYDDDDDAANPDADPNQRMHFVINQQDYIKSDGTFCPYCGDNHHIFTYETDMTNVPTTRKLCLKCRNFWIDFYQLTKVLPHID